MKKLYVNGDSHSAGHDAGGPLHSYGAHIAKSLEFELVCDAIDACSNESIYNRTLKYLENSTPDFLIIGWSTWERETWWYGDNCYHVTSSGVDCVHPALANQYKQWVIDAVTPQVQIKKEEQNHQRIWNLHCLLKESKIPHLFFNCYSYFSNTVSYNKSQFEWGNNYINPYSKIGTYYFWLEAQGFKPSNPKYFHYGQDAHVAWANFILPKIQSLLTE